MKPLCITFLTCAIILLSVIGIFPLNAPVQEEYLRIHIRANSNLEQDQEVKYQIKESLVNYLTPVLSQCKTKEKAEIELKARLTDIERIADKVLSDEGYSYKSKASVREELFPTRTYDELTLEKGYYDALIVELGEGKGDNWWCVVYPPLCFVESGHGYVYKSKIAEIIKDFFISQGET